MYWSSSATPCEELRVRAVSAAPQVGNAGPNDGLVAIYRWIGQEPGAVLTSSIPG
jgi:hypothetical protein